MSSFLFATIPCSTIFAASNAKESGSDNYENYGDHEVQDLYDFVKCRKLVFKQEHEPPTDQAAEPYSYQRSRTSSVKQALQDSFWIFVGMRLCHSDNSMRSLAAAYVSRVAATVTPVT